MSANSAFGQFARAGLKSDLRRNLQYAHAVLRLLLRRRLFPTVAGIAAQRVCDAGLPFCKVACAGAPKVKCKPLFGGESHAGGNGCMVVLWGMNAFAGYRSVDCAPFFRQGTFNRQVKLSDC